MELPKRVEFLIFLIIFCYKITLVDSESGLMEGSSESGSGSSVESDTDGGTEAPATDPPPIVYLDKFELGMSDSDISPVCLRRRLDGISKPIYIPNGFPIGTNVHHRAHVGTNGIISFEKGFYYWYPYPFPTPWWSVQRRYVVAPFWSDNDIRLTGEVCYEVHDGESDYLRQVNDYISKKTQTQFRGKWMLLAEWDNVHPYPHGSMNSWYSQRLKKFTNLRNSYQGVVVTDGITSFSLFTYKCNEMEWSGYWRHATVGYNAAGEYYKNHLLTGYGQVKDIGCIGTETKELNNVLYQLSLSPDIIQRRRTECLNKITEDNLKFGDVEQFTEDLQPCPCSWWQGWRDRRFRFDWNAWYSGSLCYHDRFPSSNKGSQYCCYRLSSPGWGSLKSSSESGRYGTNMLRFHPRFFSEYQEYDLKLRETCCTKAVGLCDRFYVRRPQNNCNGYRPPPWSWGWGDPHITTLDKLPYTFNGLGEYTMIETEYSSFKMQGRTEKVRANVSATEFVALAFSVPDNETIEIQNVNDSFAIYHNGTDISNELSIVNDTYLNSEETIELTRSAENAIETTFENGISVTANISAGILHYTIAMPEIFWGETRGLLGNFNGNSSDDLISPNGTIYNADDEKEVFKFGESWRIPNAAQSLFISPNPDPDPAFEPDFIGDVLKNASSEIKEACGDDQLCIFDALQTDSLEIGLTTNRIQQKLTDEVAQFMNFPPSITGSNPLIEVTAGEVASYSFNINDTDNFSVIMTEPQLTTNANLTQGEDGTWTYSFIWTHDDPLNFTVAFIATDSFNASSILQPKVTICGCLNGGNCTFDGIGAFDNPVIKSCECKEEAWSGQFCEEDVDGCDEIGCFPGVLCADNPAPANGVTCGDCPSGYLGDGQMCDDIDECDNSASNTCDQVCTNTEGSYHCDCFTGYRLIADNITHCEDVDECEVYNDCHQECNNTIGSYLCYCKEGFLLNTDMVSCRAEVPCNKAYPLPLLCADLNGVEVFACLKGYALDDQACQDINECDLSICDQGCTNSIGSFTCWCGSNFTLGEDGMSCIDKDECLEAALNSILLCSDDRMCRNTFGGYICECPEGSEYSSLNNRCKVPSTSITSTASPTSTTAIVSSQAKSTTINPTPTVSEVPDQVSLELIIGLAVGGALVVAILIVLVVLIPCALKKDSKISPTNDLARSSPQQTGMLRLISDLSNEADVCETIVETDS